MKKILLSLAAIFVAISASAQTEVKFDFDANYASYFTTGEGVSSGSNDTYVADGEFNEDQTVTVDGVTFFVKASAADATTRNRVWASSPRLRMYNEYFTISAPGHKVTKIVFDRHSSNFNVTAEAGTLTNSEWVGNEESVKFNVAKNTQIKSVTVTVDGEEEEPKPEVHIANTPETAYTVAEANAIIAAGEALNEEVYVKGIIVSVQEISVSYGNATYFISDDGTEAGQLEIYRGYSLGGEKFTNEDEIQDGDEVIVVGKLVNYNGTYEFTTGSKIYSLNGKTYEDTPEPPYTVVGDGTLANPYTAADVQYLFKHEQAPAEDVWVKGTILGNVNTSNGTTVVPNVFTDVNGDGQVTKDDCAEGETVAVASNLSLGDETANIPVQLVAKTVVRDDLNILDHQDNIGKTVWLYGKIQKYCGVAGLKETSDYSLDGQSSGISNIVTEADSAVLYNIAGQRVDGSFKGIVVKNGKKILVK